MPKPWLGKHWQLHVRPAILNRDGWLCQIRDRGCTTAAKDVDHIVRPDDGGAWYDPGNLRAACAHCNRSRGGRAGRAKQLEQRRNIEPWPPWL